MSELNKVNLGNIHSFTKNLPECAILCICDRKGRYLTEGDLGSIRKYCPRTMKHVVYTFSYKGAGKYYVEVGEETCEE